MSDIAKLVAELRELEKFLDGSGDIDGITYGERHPDYRGNYWWRALLHERFFQAIQALEQMAENDARYRWLRAEGNEDCDVLVKLPDSDDHESEWKSVLGHHMDAAIDAARKAEEA